MINCFAARANANTLPLTPLTANVLASWLKKQPKATTAWVKGAGFDATPGSVLLLPGKDAGVTGADWHWLKRQLNMHQDWELNAVRLSCAGRVSRVRKTADVRRICEEPYIAGPGGPCKSPTS